MKIASNPRCGLTLLEVVVAMAIFLISLGAIYQLVSLGGERAVDVKVQSRASMRCQSKLNEVIVGLQPLGATGSYATFENDTELPALQWKVDAEQDTVTNLWDVKVYVKADLASGRTIETVLCQMVLDPSIRGSTLDQPATSATTAPTTDPATPAAGGAAAAPAAGGAAAPAKGGGKGAGGGAGGNKGGGGAAGGGNKGGGAGGGGARGGAGAGGGGVGAAGGAGAGGGAGAAGGAGAGGGAGGAGAGGGKGG